MENSLSTAMEDQVPMISIQVTFLFLKA